MQNVLTILFLIFFISHDAFALLNSFDPSEHLNNLNLCREDGQFEETFKHCPEKMKARHHEALKILQNASDLLSKPIKEFSNDESVFNAFQKYFKINLNHPSSEFQVRQVLAMVERLKVNIKDVQYSCYEEKTSLWCVTNPFAIVPPPKSKIILCPSYFELSNKYQVGVMIHEWCHFTGKDHIDYLPEKYCDQASKLDTNTLTRSSDMYMLFLFELGSQEETLDCF